MSAPVSTNIGAASIPVTNSKTEVVSNNGTRIDAPPLEIPKGALGKPTTVVNAPKHYTEGGTEVIVTMQSVKDGDTLGYQLKDGKAVPNAGGSYVCRVEGIDARETPHQLPSGLKPGQVGAEQATEYLKKLIDKQKVEIIVTGQAPSYNGEPGRDLCQIIVRGKNINTELVRAGVAYLADKYHPANKNDLIEAEQEAKNANRGVWKDDASQEKPWEFRKRITTEFKRTGVWPSK